MSKTRIQQSKFLSLVLRHKPEEIGMQLDPEGWLDIQELIENANARGHNLSLEIVHELVAESDKQRFALNEDGTKIRANQGHSVREVELNLPVVSPPTLLFHGTVLDFINSIREAGLQKRSRNHVHLSHDQETASRVGMRRGKPIILTIRSQEMAELGFNFFLSANGVWLTDHVPVKFIDFPQD